MKITKRKEGNEKGMKEKKGVNWLKI